ncbi:MAG TPA: TraB/GumN family protein [Steroidobacteraceae bacterium]
MGRRLAPVWLLCSLTCGLAHAGSAVWSIRGAHNTVYLAGSVHVLKQSDAELPAAFDKAYSASQTLVMELDMDQADPLAAQQFIAENGMLEGDKTLRDIVGEARYKRVAAEAEKLGLPIEALQQFEPWTVALTITELEVAKMGFDPEAGVEKQLARRANSDHKEMRGLETLDEQLSLLHGLSYEDQSRFLEMTIDESAQAQSETEAMVRAWRAGDAPQLENLLLHEYREYPTVFRALVSDRNRKWTPQLVAMLHGDHDYFVVVGALHLVGPNGLVAMLRERGYAPAALP